MDPQEATSASDVRTGVLLAGGAARRMGADKRLLTLAGRSLLARGASFLRTLFPSVVVSVAPGTAPDMGDIGDVTVLPDAYAGESPLAGIATALQHGRQPLFACAVDLAFPDLRLARTLLAAVGDADVCVPQVGDKLEPLFAIYTPACLPAMLGMLERGEHRIIDCFPQLSARYVRVDDPAIFLNVNTPADYEEARRRAQNEVREASQPALVAVVGKGDSGKTTLIEALLPELRRLGLRVGTVKHDAHSFDIDRPGKDSYRHGAAGAEAYVVSSPKRVAYVGAVDDELSLTAIARRFFAGFDLVVAEGYKGSAPFRVEVFRLASGHDEPLCGPGEALALVTDASLPHPHRFALNDSAGLAAFLAVRMDSLRGY